MVHITVVCDSTSLVINTCMLSVTKNDPLAYMSQTMSRVCMCWLYLRVCAIKNNIDCHSAQFCHILFELCRILQLHVICIAHIYCISYEYHWAIMIVHLYVCHCKLYTYTSFMLMSTIIVVKVVALVWQGGNADWTCMLHACTTTSAMQTYQVCLELIANVYTQFDYG